MANMMFLYLIAALLLLLCLLEPTNGHGCLLEPPGRSSMWRAGFDVPINYDDHQLYCGGFRNLVANGGKCGICGDPYQGPRENEVGGKYATGTIGRTFSKGQTIEVKIELTANHLGWFEFKVCPNNNVHREATQECLDRHVLQLADGSGSKFHVGSSWGMFHVQVVLPEDVTCTQCVLQWRYHTGNSNGFNAEGKSCMGCGLQEEFYACADIAIGTGPDSNPQPIDTHLPTTLPGAHVIPPAVTPGGQVNPPSFIAGSVDLPNVGGGQVVNPPAVIPSGANAVRCFAVSPLWRDNPSYDLWCAANCKEGNCPVNVCACI